MGVLPCKGCDQTIHLIIASNVYGSTELFDLSAVSAYAATATATAMAIFPRHHALMCRMSNATTLATAVAVKM